MHQHMVSWFGSICGRIEWNAFALRGFVCIYSSYRNWCHSCASVCIEILIKKFTFYFFQIAFDVCQLPLSLKCSHMHRTGKKSHFFLFTFQEICRWFLFIECSRELSNQISFHIIAPYVFTYVYLPIYWKSSTHFRNHFTQHICSSSNRSLF